jgi:hypothetical protein
MPYQNSGEGALKVGAPSPDHHGTGDPEMQTTILRLALVLVIALAFLAMAAPHTWPI